MRVFSFYAKKEFDDVCLLHNHIKIFFKMSTKIAKKVIVFEFFDSSQKKKTISPKSFVIYDIYGVLPIKIDLHPPGTPKPLKN